MGRISIEPRWRTPYRCARYSATATTAATPQPTPAPATFPATAPASSTAASENARRGTADSATRPATAAATSSRLDVPPSRSEGGSPPSAPLGEGNRPRRSICLTSDSGSGASPRNWLSVKPYGEVLHLAPGTLRNQRRTLGIPVILRGKTPLFAAQDVADYLERIRTAARAA